MSKSIYNLSEEYERLFQEAIDEETGELNMSAEFAGIEGEINDKILATALVIKRLESEEMSIREEEDRLRNRRTKREKSKKHLKNIVREFMGLTGVNKTKNEYISVYLGSQSRRIEITNIDIVPTEYTIRISREVSLREIKKAYDEGKPVPGTRSVPGNYRLTIK